MLVSENVLKWAMRFYPPLFFQRIWIKRIEKGFCGATVKINHSILNINYNRSIFGGSIYSAADAFFPVLFYQALGRKGLKATIWVKSAAIDFLRPGKSSLYLNLVLNDDSLSRISGSLESLGRSIETVSAEILDKQGMLCARVKIDIYISTFKQRKNN